MLSVCTHRNPKHRIVPSMLLAGSLLCAFDDVSVEDPDFWYIQGEGPFDKIFTLY